MEIEFLSKLTNNDLRAHDYDSLQPPTGAYVDLGPDAIKLTGASIYTGYAPDISE